MKVKTVIGGTENLMIVEIDNGLYAIVNMVDKTVAYKWYWLFLAKYEPVWSADQLDKEEVERARRIVENDEPEDEIIDEQIRIREENENATTRLQQLKLIRVSREIHKGIYLD